MNTDLVKRVFAILMVLLSVRIVKAAPFSWGGAGIVPGEMENVKCYTFWGDIFAGNPFTPIGGTDGDFMGYVDGEGFHLKQCDHATTPMPIENNVWVLAVYGEMLSHDTIWNAERIPLCNWYDATMTGGFLIETPEDFYLGFRVHGYGEWVDTYWLGWFHVAVDENLEMSLLDAGIGLKGETVRIGIGPIPEPSCVLLALLGGALLVLRRKNLCCLR